LGNSAAIIHDGVAQGNMRLRAGHADNPATVPNFRDLDQIVAHPAER
jgi:hypothetical protein